jgi:hypothetical protein
MLFGRYLLGESGRSHIAGFGKDPPVHVQNMPASCEAVPQPCNFVNAYLTPSANPNILYGALVEVRQLGLPLSRSSSDPVHCSHDNVTSTFAGATLMHGVSEAGTAAAHNGGIVMDELGQCGKSTAPQFTCSLGANLRVL